MGAESLACLFKDKLIADRLGTLGSIFAIRTGAPFCISLNLNELKRKELYHEKNRNSYGQRQRPAYYPENG